jgi:hypothetical protein
MQGNSITNETLAAICGWEECTSEAWPGSEKSYRRPDQSSATTIESLGFAGSYFTLVG